MEFDAPFDDTEVVAPPAGLEQPPVRDLEVPLDAPAGSAEPYRPSHVSPSSASIFQQCPRKWKHRYRDRLPDPPGEAALAGTFAHRVLELLLQEAPAGRTRDRAKELAREVWPETATDDDFINLDLDEDAQRAFRWRGWLAVDGLWALENPEHVQVDATEQQVEVAIDGVPFRGIIDRVDQTPGGLAISDYKSGAAPSHRFKEGRLAQVLLYAAAVRELRGAMPTAARLLYLGQRVDEVQVTDENLAETSATLRSTWDTLQSSCDTDCFEASTGPLCAWCPFVAHCPEGQAEVQQRHLAGRVRADAPALAIVPVAS